MVYAAIRESLNTLVGDPLLPDGYYLIPLDSSATLVASRTPLNHHVHYALAGGNSATPSHADVATDAQFSLASAPTRAGYRFAGWSDGADTYAAGATYPSAGPILNDVSLTATWKAEKAGNAVVGFAPGTSKLTKPMMHKLNAIAKSSISTKQMTCVGYTAGPNVLAIDKYIALNRANVVCNYLAKKSSKLSNFKVKIVNTKIVSADQRKTEITFGK